MNNRQKMHRVWRAARHSDLYGQYDMRVRQLREGIPEDTTEAGLASLLRHAVSSVPYYREYRTLPVSDAPFEALRAFPSMDKATIRREGNNLYSADLPRRKWTMNTSGGSTGEPVRLVQDTDYADSTEATVMLYHRLLGLEPGERRFWLWGSEKEILEGGPGLVRSAKRFFSNSVFYNAFRMTDAGMTRVLTELDRHPPRLIIAYAQAAYGLARFAEKKGLAIAAQNGIVATAGTLHPFMRETIQRVFGCPVYNQYGSREVASIACEIPGSPGLWVAPWNCYVEIVDPQGAVVEDGVEGEIVVTSLANFAMPLIRYRIGDRGALVPRERRLGFGASQVLEHVSGRIVDTFRLRDGTLVDGCYVIMLLFFRDWIRAYQVIQKGEDWLVFRVVPEGRDVPPGQWEEICDGVRKLFGADCRVDLEIVQEIPPSPSGKYRYTVCELAD